MDRGPLVDATCVNPRILRFLHEYSPPTPCLVLDLDVVGERYDSLVAALPGAQTYYATKANPSPEVLRVLVARGSKFDVASPQEIDLCLAAGASPHDLSYGSTIKKSADISYAYERGVTLFAFDSDAELEKIAHAAPGSTVLCRLLVSSEGAEWPLSRKFGCDENMAVDLLAAAPGVGLDPAGVMFHVGSQQREPRQWDRAIAAAARVFAASSRRGVDLRILNLGGGFPGRYRDPVPGIDVYGAAIFDALAVSFGGSVPEVLLEPGRFIAADAGVIRSEVVLVARKSASDEKRWVYLDVGLYSGLVETIGEATRFNIVPTGKAGPVGPVVIAGPTCDSLDILYERADYQLPLDLVAGDTVDILSAGAYTTTYSTVGFNGFAPLPYYCVS